MFRFQNRIGKVAALIATTVILPVLAYAGTDNGKGNHGQNNGNQNGEGDNGNQNGHHVPVLPETDALWALIPVAGVVLLGSARQFARRKAQQVISGIESIARLANTLSNS